MDFLLENRIIKVSEKYSPIYEHLNEKYEIKYQDLFMIAMSLGFRNNKKSSSIGQGVEIRYAYFKDIRSLFYTIILVDPELGKDIKKFNNKQFVNMAIETAKEYAEGGMDILVDEVFKYNWDNGKLNEEYNEYNIDLLSYIYKLSKEVPF